MRLLLAALALVTATSASAQAEPLLMAPSSRWVADYAEGSCALRRKFNAADKEVLLELRQFEPSDEFEVRLIGKSLAVTGQPPRVRFEPDVGFFEPPSVRPLEGEGAGGVSYYDSLRPIALRTPVGALRAWPTDDRNARERAITDLFVTGAFDQPVVLQTGPMDQAMQALRTCLDDLFTGWGLDAAAQHNLSRAARPIDPLDMARRIMSEPGPSGRPAGHQERKEASLRVIVGADGKAQSCFANVRSQDPAIDERGCKLMMRYGRFEPALDANGQPVASTYRTTIVF